MVYFFCSLYFSKLSSQKSLEPYGLGAELLLVDKPCFEPTDAITGCEWVFVPNSRIFDFSDSFPMAFLLKKSPQLEF